MAVSSGYMVSICWILFPLSLTYYDYMGDCQNYGPLLGPYYSTAFRVP